MSNLTYLNEASVLHNMKARYVAKLIYVSVFNDRFSMMDILQDRNRRFSTKTNEYYRQLFSSYIPIEL